jgi:hypothetical protein
MTAARLLRVSLSGRSWPDDRGAQLVEFAVTLPLMMVFVVGIFAAAAEPATDLGRTLPMSVNDAFLAVDNYLIANQINDCGITATGSPTGLTWTFTASGNGCASPGLTLTINRGYYFSQSGAGLPSVSCASQAPGGGQTAVVGTCVSIQYPYPWRFGRVASLLGSAVALPTQISATAVTLNEN